MLGSMSPQAPVFRKPMGASDIVFHYTSADGLRGILRPDKPFCFRLTELHYLSDKAEWLHTFALVRLWLQNLAADLTYPEFAQSAREQIAKASPVDSRVGTQRIFSMSFTEHENKPSQWSGYGCYAIGFRHGDLARIAQRLDVQFLPCEYDLGRKNGALRRILPKRMLPSVETFDARAMDRNWTQYLQAVAHMAAYFKDGPALNASGECLDEEGEWRFVARLQVGDSRIDQDSGDKYCWFSLGAAAAEFTNIQLHVGPGGDMEKALEVANAFSTSHCVEVKVRDYR